MDELLELLGEIVFAIIRNVADTNSSKGKEHNAVKYIQDDYNQKNPRIFLLVMMLTRIYFFDDNKIDNKEKRRIFKLVKEYKKKLNLVEQKHLKNSHFHTWSINDIETYITHNHITESDLRTIFYQLQNIIYEQPKYQSQYNQLYSTLIKY